MRPLLGAPSGPTLVPQGGTRKTCTTQVLDIYPNGVSSHSPGSRIAPWGRVGKPESTLKGLPQAAAAPGWNPVGVHQTTRYRFPGCCATLGCERQPRRGKDPIAAADSRNQPDVAL